ncbi:unnamed protein product [Urochloa humidicola]
MKQLLRGSKDLSDFENWQQSLDNDIYCSQVKRCIRIAQLCVDDDQHRRPTIDCIIDMLNKKETVIETTVPPDLTVREIAQGLHNMYVSSESRQQLSGINNSEKLEYASEVSSDSSRQLPVINNPKKLESTSEASSSYSKWMDEVLSSLAVSAAPCEQQRKIGNDMGPAETSAEIHTSWSSENSKLLDVHPVEIHFPFELNKLITCPVSLTNRTQHHVGAWIKPVSSDTRFGGLYQCSSLFGIVEPHSTWVMTISMKKQRQPLLPRKGTDKFEVLMVVMRSEQELQLLKSPIGKTLNMNYDFLRRVEELGGKMHRAMLTPAIVDSTSCPEEENHQS